MKLSITSWSFPKCTLTEAVALSGALGIGSIDLGYFYRPALDKAKILSDPESAARLVRDLGLPIPSFYHLFGDTLHDRNLADPASRERNIEDFEIIARFCKLAGIPAIFVLPGMINRGQGRREAFECSVKALAELSKIASQNGIILTIEPHVHSFFDSPIMVLDLLNRVPDLRLTLDYAHFVCMGFPQCEIDILAAHAAHVHLRQARPGYLQAKLDQGVIDFVALFSLLDKRSYAGALSIEYVHQAYMDTFYDDVLTETIGMRDLYSEWVG